MNSINTAFSYGQVSCFKGASKPVKLDNDSILLKVNPQGSVRGAGSNYLTSDTSVTRSPESQPEASLPSQKERRAFNIGVKDSQRVNLTPEVLVQLQSNTASAFSSAFGKEGVGLRNYGLKIYTEGNLALSAQSIEAAPSQNSVQGEAIKNSGFERSGVSLNQTPLRLSEEGVASKGETIPYLLDIQGEVAPDDSSIASGTDLRITSDEPVVKNSMNDAKALNSATSSFKKFSIDAGPTADPRLGSIGVLAKSDLAQENLNYQGMGVEYGRNNQESSSQRFRVDAVSAYTLTTQQRTESRFNLTV